MAKFKPTFIIRFGAARNDISFVTVEGAEPTVVELPASSGSKHPVWIDRKDARKELSKIAKTVCTVLGIVERTKPQRRAA